MKPLSRIIFRSNKKIVIEKWLGKFFRNVFLSLQFYHYRDKQITKRGEEKRVPCNNENRSNVCDDRNTFFSLFLLLHTIEYVCDALRKRYKKKKKEEARDIFLPRFT